MGKVTGICMCMCVAAHMCLLACMHLHYTYMYATHTCMYATHTCMYATHTYTHTHTHTHTHTGDFTPKQRSRRYSPRARMLHRSENCGNQGQPKYARARELCQATGIHVCVCLCMYTCGYVCMCTHAHAYICACVCMYT
jgi:hypothetical protein